MTPNRRALGLLFLTISATAAVTTLCTMLATGFVTMLMAEPDEPCSDKARLASESNVILFCDRSATASFHDTPHGVVLTCTCPTKEKKP